MPVHEQQFDQYYIYYMTGGNEVPLINCFKGANYVGKLVFHNTAGAPPANGVLPDGTIYLRYRLSQFQDVIGILRQEKPLYLRLSTPSLIGFLATQQGEPVGEQET
jgi:hypothetical protein